MELYGRVRRTLISDSVRDQQNYRRFHCRQIAFGTHNQINTPDMFCQDLLFEHQIGNDICEPIKWYQSRGEDQVRMPVVVDQVLHE